MHWDDEYKNKKRLWGEGPSELARAAVTYLQESVLNEATLSILDIGCGYGRDALYYAEKLECEVLGIDVSETAIEIASGTPSESHNRRTTFQIADFKDINEKEFDIICISNLYQLLKKREREEMKKAVVSALKPGGLMFLSTLSVNDPEHMGKGTPVPGESNSYNDKLYLHLCTREELEEDFAFLNIRDLYEYEYDEPRVTGEVHHHISWILIGEHHLMGQLNGDL